VRATGLEPARACAQRIFIPSAAFAAARERLWSGLSLRLSRRMALGAARLVSTPSPAQGLARDHHLKGFPEFGQFYIKGFPLSKKGRR
jgi:hypothetical protein